MNLHDEPQLDVLLEVEVEVDRLRIVEVTVGLVSSLVLTMVVVQHQRDMVLHQFGRHLEVRFIALLQIHLESSDEISHDVRNSSLLIQ